MEERFYKFSNLSSYPEIIHGISNRSYGDMKFGKIPESDTIKNRQQFFQDLGVDIANVVVPEQVHSDHIAIVSVNDKGKGSQDIGSEIPDVDGLITKDPGIYLMIKTADCLPVLIYDASLRIVAAIHAGWQGISQQIVYKAINQLVNLGSDPENLVVAIGPGICQKHFVVRDSVLKTFLENYPSATLVRNKDGYVDLKKAVLIDLKKAKVHPTNIENAHFCTVCDNGVYGSFRKEGNGAPYLGSIIGMKG